MLREIHIFGAKNLTITTFQFFKDNIIHIALTHYMPESKT